MIRVSMFVAAALLLGAAAQKAQACSYTNTTAAVTAPTVADAPTDLSSANKKKKKKRSTGSGSSAGSSSPGTPASSSPSGY